jgi:hypothetical protein
VHGVEGTTLQAIADEMGVSRAAVYCSRSSAPTPEGDLPTHVAVLMFTTGILTPIRDPGLADVDRDTLRDTLVDAGRRLLRVRRPPAAE